MVDKFEQLALWYLRLNGYLTVPNFILHPATRRQSQRGEVDILGVRFPYSREVAGAEMERDNNLIRDDKKIDFIIAEVTRSKCKLNKPWKEPHTDWQEYVLSWLGMIPPNNVSSVAKKLYSDKRYEGDKWAIRLVCFGSQKSEDLSKWGVVQLTWEKVIKFISGRFKQFKDTKQDKEQWDPFVKELFNMMVTKRPNEILAWLRN